MDYVEGKDFKWVNAKDGKGNPVLDGKGKPVKTRKFFTKSEKAAMAAPKAAPKATPKAAPKAATPKPKARPASLNPQSGAAQSGVKGKVTKPSAQSGAAQSGVTGKVKSKASPTANRPAKAAEISGQKVAPAKSGASRSTAGKVREVEGVVPGRAVIIALKNFFRGDGETNIGKVSGARKPANAGRSSVASEMVVKPKRSGNTSNRYPARKP